MEGQVCVVTGANGAMGAITTEALARRGATVVMLCRNRGDGEAVRDRIAQATENSRLEVVGADLSSQEDVRRAAAEITASHGELHVLVNNAGVFLAERQETAEGIEKTFATNYLSHFLLTQLLLDALKSGASARIVSVASRTGRYKLDFDDVMLTKKYSAIPAASQSKLALVMFTVELAKRLDGSGVTANCLHPGLVKSGVYGELSAMWRTFINLFATTPEKGAQTAIRLASSPDVEGVSGQFFGPKNKQLKLPEQAANEEARKRLWELSIELTGLGKEPAAAPS
jgi:NAD(P)-dependent dehydrogenase (short-subunit alcohol dehydrogenase family)